MNHTGTLFVIATPIGNLEDITVRALRILGAVDYILCEDTRVTKKLLTHYHIATPTKRYDAHASEATHQAIVADVRDGKQVALVSDAGTPGVSDPGVRLIQRARTAGARIEAIPGPSALTTALSIAGVPGNQFTFLGFIPQKKGRETFFATLTEHIAPVVCFESTHRIMKTLAALEARYPTATVYLARELTKQFEELRIGTPAEISDTLSRQPEKQRGEFVLLITPVDTATSTFSA